MLLLRLLHYGYKYFISATSRLSITGYILADVEQGLQSIDQPVESSA